MTQPIKTKEDLNNLLLAITYDPHDEFRSKKILIRADEAERY